MSRSSTERSGVDTPDLRMGGLEVVTEIVEARAAESDFAVSNFASSIFALEGSGMVRMEEGGDTLESTARGESGRVVLRRRDEVDTEVDAEVDAEVAAEAAAEVVAVEVEGVSPGSAEGLEGLDEG